jgi:glutathione S-transferase
LRHVARKHGLMAQTEAEQARLEMLEQQVVDLRTALTSLCYNQDKFEELKPEFVKSIPDRLKQWSEYLAEHKFLVGDRVTYVDFMLYDVLDIYRIFESTSLTAFANLQQFVERIEKLPTIATYFSSGKYHKLPYNGAIAKWGNVRL